MKRMLCILCVLFMLLSCGCTSEKQAAAHMPIEKFFAGLNEADFEKYKKSYLPETVNAIGAFEFEAKYLEYRKAMQGERVIYEILETTVLSGDAAQDVETYYCDALGITCEQVCLIRLRSNLTELPPACYCIQKDGEWSILSWYTLKNP